MTRLDLSEEEATELEAALARGLHTLRTELAAAEDRAFKASLRVQLDRLERIAARLTESARKGPMTGPAAIDSRRAERLAQPEEAEAEAEELFAGGSLSAERPLEATGSTPNTTEEQADQRRAASRQPSDEERPARK
jgi:hypothetical protein